MAAFAIFGTGGFGREVAPLVRGKKNAHADVVFVSDGPGESGTVRNGIKVVSFEELISPSHRHRQIVVAVADPTARRRIVQRCSAQNLGFTQVQAPTARIYDDVQIGAGTILCENTIVTSNVRIGTHFHCNIYSYVAHDCVIGNFVTFAPRVNCNGNVVIEDDVYVGTGAFIKQGVTKPLVIGRGAVIGMGAVVTKDVPPGAVIAGNPGKQIGTE